MHVFDTFLCQVKQSMGWRPKNEVGAAKSFWGAVADLGGGPRFSQFHAVFSHMLAPPRRVCAPSHGESWICPWGVGWQTVFGAEIRKYFLGPQFQINWRGGESVKCFGGGMTKIFVMDGVAKRLGLQWHFAVAKNSKSPN